MLLLIGLGLDTKDISVRSIEALKKADKIAYEHYTAFVSSEYLDFIENASGKKIVQLDRPDLEEGAGKLISEAQTKRIAILVPGDPLVATTHHTILDAASRMGVDTAVFHSSSVYSAAVGESGLDVYKFGEPVTIPFWSDKYKPTSFLDVIRTNLDNGMHTLVLLDVDSKDGSSMGFKEAIALLEQADKERGYGIIGEETKALFLSDLGRESQRIVCSKLKDAKQKAMREGKMRSIIIPAKLNFVEEEALSKFSG